MYIILLYIIGDARAQLRGSRRAPVTLASENLSGEDLLSA